MKLESYWLDSAPRFSTGSDGPVEGRVDVAVIGGGFTGLSAALAIAQKGAKVTVLEAGIVAAEGSGRNGGHVNNGLAHSFSSIVEEMGVEDASALYRAFNDAVDSVEKVIAEQVINCDFRRSGKIKLAGKAAHFEALARNCELLSKEGVDPDVSLLSKQEAAAEIGSDVFYGGLLHRRSAMMHMGRFGTGLAEAAVRAGAEIFENAAVNGKRRLSDGKWELSTARGKLIADQVLVATGVRTVGPFSWFRRRYIAVGSFIIATEPIGEPLLATVMPGRRTATTSRIIGNYFRMSPDNRLIFGGRARFAMSNPQSDAKSGAVLRRTMIDVFPQLKDTAIDYCWGGLLDMTADRFPRAGEHDGLYYALGYSGHGVQMSVHMGQVMAEVMDGNPDRNPFRNKQWKAIPGHFGPPWFLPFVGAYYRVLDAIK